jgi:FG-GAP repeat
LSASDGADDDQFGLLVSVSGDTIVVGARLADSHGDAAGAA